MEHCESRDTVHLRTALLAAAALGCAAACGGTPPLPPCTIEGNLTISNNLDVAGLARSGCTVTVITGTLAITAPGLTTLDQPFARLVSVGALSVTGNTALASLSFPALATVSGALLVDDAPALTALRLPALSTVGGDVSLLRAPALTTLSLDALQSVGGNLEVDGAWALPALSLPTLASVGGYLAVRSLLGAASLDFPALGSAGSLSIRYNPVLAALSLPKLSATGRFDLDSNPALTALALPVLTAGELSVHANHALPVLRLPLLATGSVLVGNNAALVTIDLPTLSAGETLMLDGPKLQSVLLPGLTSVTGGLYLNDSAVTAVAWPRLETVRGAVRDSGLLLERNPSLERVALPALREVGGSRVGDGSLVISGSPALAALDLHAVTTLTWTFTVEGAAALQSLSLPLLTAVGNDLWIDGDAALATLALPALRAVPGIFAVNNNPLLRQCLVDGLIGQLSPPPYGKLVNANGGSPNQCP